MFIRTIESFVKRKKRGLFLCKFKVWLTSGVLKIIFAFWKYFIKKQRTIIFDRKSQKLHNSTRTWLSALNNFSSHNGAVTMRMFWKNFFGIFLAVLIQNFWKLANPDHSERLQDSKIALGSSVGRFRYFLSKCNEFKPFTVQALNFLADCEAPNKWANSPPEDLKLTGKSNCWCRKIPWSNRLVIELVLVT